MHGIANSVTNSLANDGFSDCCTESFTCDQLSDSCANRLAHDVVTHGLTDRLAHDIVSDTFTNRFAHDVVTDVVTKRNSNGITNTQTNRTTDTHAIKSPNTQSDALANTVSDALVSLSATGSHRVPIPDAKPRVHWVCAKSVPSVLWCLHQPTNYSTNAINGSNSGTDGCSVSDPITHTHGHALGGANHCANTRSHSRTFQSIHPVTYGDVNANAYKHCTNAHTHKCTNTRPNIFTVRSSNGTTHHVLTRRGAWRTAIYSLLHRNTTDGGPHGAS